MNPHNHLAALGAYIRQHNTKLRMPTGNRAASKEVQAELILKAHQKRERRRARAQGSTS